MDAKQRAKWLKNNKDKFLDIESKTKVSRSTLYGMARDAKRARLPYITEAVDSYIEKCEIGK